LIDRLPALVAALAGLSRESVAINPFTPVSLVELHARLQEAQPREGAKKKSTGSINVPVDFGFFSVNSVSAPGGSRHVIKSDANGRPGSDQDSLALDGLIASRACGLQRVVVIPARRQVRCDDRWNARSSWHSYAVNHQ
jgi:hypothetical protein